MAKLKAETELPLKDIFSQGIRKAGTAAEQFGGKIEGAARTADKALSGLHMTLATAGAGLGTAALIKGGIDYQNTVTRIAANAGVYGREVNEFGRALTQIAYNAKIPRDELAAFAGVLADNAIGMDDIIGNAPFMADVIQGLSVSGAEAGQIFTTLFKRGMDADTLKEKLNNLAEIGDRLGSVNLTQFAKNLPRISSAIGGTTADNIEDVYAAVNMLAAGTNKPKEALDQYAAVMENFKKDDTRKAMKRYLKGFDPVDDATGELKSFAEIMEKLNQLAVERGSTNYFKDAFQVSDLTIKALRQYNSHYKETIAKVGELGDTSDAVSKRAEQNAGTIAASLDRLKSAAGKFADASLIKPVELLAGLLSRHPKGMEYAVYGLAGAITTLAAMKAFSTLATFTGDWQKMKNGGGLAGGLTGGAGMPVYVTNWGGGVPGLPGTGGKPTTTAVKPPLATNARTALSNVTPKQYAASGSIAALWAVAVKGPQMVSEIKAADQNEELTAKERGRAKGEAWGDTAGTIAGAAVGGGIGVAGGAAIGAAIGSVVPGLGTAIGAIVGAGLGALGAWWGGKYGRIAGGEIGEALAKDDENAPPVKSALQLEAERRYPVVSRVQPVDMPPQLAQAGSSVPPLKAELDGQAVMDVNVNLSGVSPMASVEVRDNTTRLHFNTGSAVQVRREL